MKVLKQNKIAISVLFLLVAITLLSGCAQNGMLQTGEEAHTYGFFGGLWHGFIAPFGLVGMLIWDDVAMFAPINNGTWYSFGFLLGSGGWGLLASRRRK